MPELPEGTVTFLFTDIQGSTELLKQLHKDYINLLAEERRIMRSTFDEWGGKEVDTQGDSFFVSFPRATEAVAAVVEIQKSLAAFDWPEGVAVHVRMGMHTGEPWLVEEGYVGMDVHRAARIGHVGHGGQVLLSETTAALVRDELPDEVCLADLGRHRLKDMRRPEHVYQLVIEDLPETFPPLESLEASPQDGELIPDDGGVLRKPRPVGESPYRGLAAFREADADFFYGREAFTAQLVDSLQHRQLVAVVVGSSGSGKSSLVYAGLLPHLSASEPWVILSFRPGTDPFLSLAGEIVKILEPELGETEHVFSSQRLADGIQEGEVSLFHTLERLNKEDGNAGRVLLFIDQFEELYTLVADIEIREAFLDEMIATSARSLDQRPNPFVFLLTLRADFMGQALTHRPFADALQDGSMMLGPMNREELHAAIEKPAAMQGAAFEPGLVTRILDDVGEEPGNLPLLEFALTLLWERLYQGWLTHAVYEEIGQVDGALANYADEVYASLAPEEQEQTRKAFVQLVQPGQGTEDTRRIANQEDLAGVDWGLIQHLADRRLIVTGLDEKGGETVEVVHEALIRGWGLLRGWMATDRAFRIWQEGLRAALRAWENSSMDDGALLRGAPLATAEEWLNTRSTDLSPLEVEYIETSLAYRTQVRARREHRRRLIIGGLVAGFLVAVVLSIFAFSERNSAYRSAVLAEQSAATAQVEAKLRSTQQILAETEAEARATQQAVAEDAQNAAEREARNTLARNLAYVAMQNIAFNPQLSLLLALQAVEQTYKLDKTVLPDGLTALHQAVRANNRLLVTIPAKEGRDPYVSFHPDGKHLTVYYFHEGADPKDLPINSLTSIYNAYTGELLHELPEGMVANHWPDSGYVGLVDLLDEFTLELTLWDTQEGIQSFQTQLEIPYETPISQVFAMGLNHDLTQFALSINFVGQTLIWDLASSELIVDFPEDEVLDEIPQYFANFVEFNSTLPSHLIFSPDGKQVIVPFEDAQARVSETKSGSLEFYNISNPDSSRYENLQGGRYSLTPDGRTWAWTTGQNVTLFDYEFNEQPLTFFRQGETQIVSLTYSPDSSRLATLADDGIVTIWDVKSSLTDQGEHLDFMLETADPSIYQMSLSSNGTRMATVGDDGQVKIWDIQPSGGIELFRFANDHILIEGDWSSIDLNPDGGRLAFADSSNIPSIWDTTTGNLLFTLEGHIHQVEDIDISPDGSLLVTCSDSGPLKIWNAETGVEIAELNEYNEGSCSLDFLPNGTSIVLGVLKNETGWYQVVDIPAFTSDEPNVISFPPPNVLLGSVNAEPIHIAISPDGTHVGFTYRGILTRDSAGNLPQGRDLTFRTFELDSGRLRQLNTANIYQNYINLAYANDGKFLAATLPNGTIEIWDIISSESIKTFQGHRGSVNAAAFSPDDKWLATAGSDRTTKIWELETGQVVMTLTGHTGAVTDVVFSPDGTRLYTAGMDGTARAYIIDIDELITLGKSKLTRDLTEEECQKYLLVETCADLS